MEVIFWNSKLIFTEKKSYFYKTKHNSVWSKALSSGKPAVTIHGHQKLLPGMLDLLLP